MVANQRKILVTGATGQQGGSLARLLLQKKHRVYALTRNTQSPAAQDLQNRGANIVKGDLDDSDSLKRAVKDVQSVFLMGTPFEDGTEGETRRGKLMADIAKENNIESTVQLQMLIKIQVFLILKANTKLSSILKTLEFLIPSYVLPFYGKLAWSRIKAESTGFTFISIYHLTTKCS